MQNKKKEKENKTEKIVNVFLEKNKVCISDRCVYAISFFERFLGLMGRKKFLEGEGMFFPRCTSIHMWWMRIPIDVVFLKKTETGSIYEVVACYEEVLPWKKTPLFCFKAEDTLELPSGTVKKFQILKGDFLCIN